MKIIDLSLEIFEGMPVYNGDPELKVKQIFNIEKDGWNMKRLHMNTHDGTHVNVPSHCNIDGENLDDYKIEDFCGECIVYAEGVEFEEGVIFKQDINLEIAKLIVKKNVKFVGLSYDFKIDEGVEKYFLENRVIVFENLVNVSKLPKKFFFCGVPLKIRKGDGSPVRAYAIINYINN